MSDRREPTEPLLPATLDLVARAGSGDRRAAEALIVCYQGRIARFVIAQTKDAAHYEYEDVCQAVFVKMVLALPRLRSPERFEPWLFTIARNACNDHLRARRSWRKHFTAYAPEHDAVPALESSPEGSETVETCIAGLPKGQRRVIRLSLEGGSYKELARQSRTSVSALKSRLHRARVNLRALMLAGDSE